VHFLDARALAAAATLVLASPHAAAAAARWPWPAHGPVVARFALGPDPYARGQHRGIDIAAPRGAAVRSACGGRVRFAGRAAAFGRAVSVECGPWIVSYGHLGSVAVHRGAPVGTGETLGSVGAALHLGVRRRGERHGYVDPLALLADPGLPVAGPGGPYAPRRAPAPPPAAGPLSVPLSRRLPHATPRPRPAPLPAPAPRRLPHSPPAAAPHLPLTAWAGAALLATAVPGLALVGTARRRRRRTRARARREEVVASR
jgi:hypothetical protein